MNRPVARRRALWLAATVLGAVARPLPAATLPADSASRPLTLAVLGHVRGRDTGLNPLFVETLEQLRRLRPDVVILTGDIIWGDNDHDLADSAVIEREWQEMDSALATLGLPVYRIPGNHDWHDPVTSRAWLRRYGTLPQAVNLGRVRLLLLSTMPPPPAGAPARVYPRRSLDSAQVAFLRAELADPTAYDHAFVFMGHLLWWANDSTAWWREVHPLLVAGRVSGVFSGDLGPLKFSHVEHAGVHYYQSAIETQPVLALLQRSPAARLISAQLDNFLIVTLQGAERRVEVHTVGAESSGRFTRDRYTAVYQQPLTWEMRQHQVSEAVGGRRRLAAGVLLALLASFLLGMGVSRRWAGRGTRHS